MTLCNSREHSRDGVGGYIHVTLCNSREHSRDGVGGYM